MSFNDPAIPVVKIVSPEIDFSARRQYVVIEAPEVRTAQVFQANNPTTASVQINFNPPNSRTGMDAVVLLNVRTTLQLDAGNVPVQYNIGETDGLRAFPIQSCVSSETLGLNNYSVSINPNQYLHGLMAYKMSDWDVNKDCSLCPCMPDQTQIYNDPNQGSARNVLANYGENSYLMSRGGFIYSNVRVPAGNANALWIDVDITEPLLVSPLSFSGRPQSLIGLTTASLFLTFANNMNRMWCRSIARQTANPVTFSVNPTGGVGFQVQIMTNFFTPSPAVPVPDVLQYPYVSLQYFQTDPQTVGQAGDLVFNMNNIQLQSIPQEIYIFARRSNEYINDPANGRNMTVSDCFAPITNINMTFDNRNGLFASCSPQQLYQISSRNGLNMSWIQFRQYMGSVIKITPVDMGLQTGMSAGVQGAYNFFVRVNCNFPASAVGEQYTLYAVVISEGTFSISRGLCSSQTGILSRYDVLNAPITHSISYREASSISKKQGGSWLNGIFNIAKKVAPFVSPVDNLFKKGDGLHVSGGSSSTSGGRAIDRSEFIANYSR